MASAADAADAVVLRAQLTTAVAYLTAAREEAAASADDTMQHINAALEVLTTLPSGLELFPSEWKGLKAVPKGKGKGKDKDGKGKDKEERYFMREEEKFAEMVRKGKGKDKGKGKSASEILFSSSSSARSRSPQPAWVRNLEPVAPPSPQTPPE